MITVWTSKESMWSKMRRRKETKKKSMKRDEVDYVTRGGRHEVQVCTYVEQK